MGALTWKRISGFGDFYLVGKKSLTLFLLPGKGRRRWRTLLHHYSAAGKRRPAVADIRQLGESGLQRSRSRRRLPRRPPPMHFQRKWNSIWDCRRTRDSRQCPSLSTPRKCLHHRRHRSFAARAGRHSIGRLVEWWSLQTDHWSLLTGLMLMLMLSFRAIDFHCALLLLLLRMMMKSRRC